MRLYNMYLFNISFFKKNGIHPLQDKELQEIAEDKKNKKQIGKLIEGSRSNGLVVTTFEYQSRGRSFKTST